MDWLVPKIYYSSYLILKHVLRYQDKVGMLNCSPLTSDGLVYITIFFFGFFDICREEDYESVHLNSLACTLYIAVGLL